MHYGLSEKSILALWHPDAMSLFNVTSNLKRVCWELYDPDVRLSSSVSTIVNFLRLYLSNIHIKEPNDISHVMLSATACIVQEKYISRNCNSHAWSFLY